MFGALDLEFGALDFEFWVWGSSPLEVVRPLEAGRRLGPLETLEDLAATLEPL